MDVNKVVKKHRINLFDSVRLQIINHIIFERRESLADIEITVMTMLGVNGKTNLKDFCSVTSKAMYVITETEDYSKKSQHIRNVVTKLTSKGYIIKSGSKGKKDVELNEGMKIVNKGNILLDFKYLTADESKNV